MKKFFSFIICWLEKQLTFTKLMLVWLTYKCVGWIDQSYALAWANNGEIAESLSTVVMKLGVGAILAYMVKSTVSSLSENNNWPDKPIDRDC